MTFEGENLSLNIAKEHWRLYGLKKKRYKESLLSKELTTEGKT